MGWGHPCQSDCLAIPQSPYSTLHCMTSRGPYKSNYKSIWTCSTALSLLLKCIFSRCLCTAFELSACLSSCFPRWPLGNPKSTLASSASCQLGARVVVICNRRRQQIIVVIRAFAWVVCVQNLEAVHRGQQKRMSFFVFQSAVSMLLPLPTLVSGVGVGPHFAEFLWHSAHFVSIIAHCKLTKALAIFCWPDQELPPSDHFAQRLQREPNHCMNWKEPGTFQAVNLIKCFQ